MNEASFFVSEIPGYDAVFYFRRKVVAEIGQDVYSSYREYIRLHENTSCQGKPRHPKRAKWRVIAMAKN
ncbi:hypothetical protein LNL97_29785, partial [Escherichia coli]|nr:hypothetical protein [Escherichia coli]